MRRRKALVYSYLLLLSGGISGCSDPNKQPLASHYYTTMSEDGEPGLYFDDPQLGPTYLEFAVAVGTAKNYVVICGNDYYIFPVAAATAEAARRAQIGPLSKAACAQKVFQLIGDSLHLESINL